MNSITQNVIPNSKAPSTLPVRHFERRHAAELATRLEELKVQYAGIAIRQNDATRIVTLAIASPDAIYKISVDVDKGYREFLVQDAAFAKLLCGQSTTTLVGFGMGRLALSIHRDFRLRVRGLDAPTICSDKTSDPWSPTKILVELVHGNIDRRQCYNLWAHLCEENDDQSVCLRAWLAARVALAISARKIESGPRVDTSHLSTKELEFLEDVVAQCDLLDLVKPKEAPNEFTKGDTKLGTDGKLRLINARYRTRVRPSRQTAIIMVDSTGREFVGQARASHGRTTTIRFNDNGKNFAVDKLESVKVVGVQEATNAERAREEFLLMLLQGKASLKHSSLIQQLWFLKGCKRDEDEIEDQARAFKDFGLNASQRIAAGTMTSRSPIVIVHGPPGTGKTTTISAVAKMWSSKRLPVWICAHSNVAVKNLAQALFKKNVKFKIIVSKDFYVEWHEHLYEQIVENLFRTDELPPVQDELDRLLGGTKVILSTLSQLSNPGLRVNGMFDIVPLERLVIDEASQINVVEYLHIFGRFPKLNKICFFGDPEQLPPYGKDRISSLKSVFDFPQIKKMASMLNVQYRMPVPLGNFISKWVYGGRLQSDHKILEENCIAFVNVPQGCEGKSGFSWTNQAEVETVVDLVRDYYRRTTSFCIITPYDAQRALIERRLKGLNLPWENVFNVDSFQGNEADYVIISLVRTGRPGFLTLLQRMNVMLTRCRKGMIIVANRDFLTNRNGGLPTLVGRLAEKLASRWVNSVNISGGDVDLPGFPALGTRRKDLDNPVISVNYDWSSSSSTPSTWVHHSRTFAQQAPAPAPPPPPQAPSSFLQSSGLFSHLNASSGYVERTSNHFSPAFSPTPPAPVPISSTRPTNPLSVSTRRFSTEWGAGPPSLSPTTTRVAPSPVVSRFQDLWDDTQTFSDWDSPTSSPTIPALASPFYRMKLSQSPTLAPKTLKSQMPRPNVGSEASFPSLLAGPSRGLVNQGTVDIKPSSFSLLKKKASAKSLNSRFSSTGSSSSLPSSPAMSYITPSSVSMSTSYGNRLQGGVVDSRVNPKPPGQRLSQEKQRQLSSSSKSGVFRMEGSKLKRDSTHK